ncbi:hypothetical protein BGW38_003420 [Lunasporangiospora selenospora]|uniref:F-box domain-containing protein n=1 Tax=Lunasporangiospora selenospora TaxID=979761 RepID=A0A9P6G576_9FUNG|nr:hypothetical protein BGW38_003420 [Lunasporangiospora selenospora]
MSDSIQIGYMPPGDGVSAQNVMELVAYGQVKGLDFVVSPINSPAYRRVLFEGHEPQSVAMREWRAGLNAMTPSDLVLQTASHAQYIVGTLPQWQEFDSTDARVRLHSELALKQQLGWASHIALGGILLPFPSSQTSSTNYGRVLTTHLSNPMYTSCWLMVPCLDEELERGVSEEEQGIKSWERWNELRNMAGFDSKLGVALVISGTLPSDSILDRWLAEPVKVVILPEEVFLTNPKGYPVLSKRYQTVIRRLMKHTSTFVISSAAFPKLVVDEFSDDALEQHPSSPHADYLRYLLRTQESAGVIDQFAHGYQDYLQMPLQPLQDHLDYNTYEKDPIKYQLYESAIEKALQDRPVPTNGELDITVIMVVGAGRGPLVNCALRASEKAARNVRVYAVEKNPNAFITIQNKKASIWGDRVNIVFSDMRTWKAPEKADILVSELLGSFGDNELSPECLDGAQKFLKPDGISIPYNYTAFVAPMMSNKLHNDVSGFKEAARLESSYVVMFKSVSLLAEPKPIWTFEHPNRVDLLPDEDPLSNHHNVRYGSIEFTSDAGGMLHGVAGYFESVLYKDILMSINPETHSPGMFSWFPIYFPIKTPLYVPAKAQVVVDFWRLTDSRKVWYEWRVTCKLEGRGVIQSTPIHNVGGKSSTQSKCPSLSVPTMMAGSQDVRKKLQDIWTDIESHEDRESHEFFPAEVWIQICRYLYPSQLSQMSMVNKSLNSIVSQLNVWSRIFAITYGPKAQLRLLGSTHESKSYMLYMCASSRHVCERCFARADYQLDAAYKLPHPTPMLLPRRSTETAIYLGDRIDLTWTIRMCLPCRKDHFLVYEEPYELGLQRQIQVKALYYKYPSASRVPLIASGSGSGMYSNMSEKTAVFHMRDYFGGDIGIKQSKESTIMPDNTTEARLRWYQLQP